MDAFDKLSEWLDENNTEMNDMSDKAMRITEGKGFHLDLPNGVTVSVQFGPGNYADDEARRKPSHETQDKENGPGHDRVRC